VFKDKLFLRIRRVKDSNFPSLAEMFDDNQPLSLFHSACEEILAHGSAVDVIL